MYKTFLVAWREFTATVLTKGFIIGILMTPLMLLLVMAGVAATQMLKGPSLMGTLAVIDQTGEVQPHLERRFSKDEMEKERANARERAERLAQDKAKDLGISADQARQASGFAKTAVDNAMASVDAIDLIMLPRDADVETEKASLATVDLQKARESGKRERIALAVIQPEVLTKSSGPGGGEYPRYQLFTVNRIDPEIQQRIEGKINDAIVDARVSNDPRAKAAKLSVEDLRALLSEPRSTSAAITTQGERKSGGALQFMLPMAFMLLLLMSVMTGGQYLLTSTIEEKSNRVMEVLLSAVSPMQLMVGKIIGQMCVGLVILVLYSGLGISALIAFSLQHQVSPMMLVYLVIFFFIAFFIIASMMAAVGSAVSELREAQTLMTPVMVFVMVPWLLWLPISRAPNSTFSTIASFVPGINPFVMLIRLSSSEPPPLWQTLLAIGVGILTVVLFAWAAAKIFRVGVLMYGKAPNWRTLWRWIRMA